MKLYQRLLSSIRAAASLKPLLRVAIPAALPAAIAMLCIAINACGKQSQAVTPEQLAQAPATGQPPVGHNDTNRNVSTFDEEDEWDIVSFTDPRDESEYDIIDGRVIVAWRDWEPIVIEDPNAFDNPEMPPSGWEESATYPSSRLEEEDIVDFIAAEDLESYAEWPEVAAAAFILPEGQTVEDAVENWPTEYSDLIEVVDPDALGSPTTFPTTDPNDDDFDNTAPTNDEWYLDEGENFDINVQNMWRETSGYGSSGAVVAIIDTGCEDHSSLYDLQNTDTAYGCNTGDRRASTTFATRANDGGEAWLWLKMQVGNGEIGHGTGIASMISATPNNDGNSTVDGYNLAGVAISPLYFPIAAKLQSGNFSTSAILNALTAVGCVKRIYVPEILYGFFCPAYNLEVVNCSFTIPENAVAKRHFDQLSPCMLFVCGSGNNNQNIVKFPASYNKTFAVGGYNESGQRASGTNYGSGIEVFAPAIDIMGYDIPGIYGISATELIITGTGTSGAAALTSGVAVVLAAAFSGDSPAEISEKLTGGGTLLTGDLSGKKGLNADGAYDY